MAERFVTAKGECPVVKEQKDQKHPPQSEKQKLWGGRGGDGKGEFIKWLGGWAPACLWGEGRAGMEHEKNGRGGE